MPTHEAKKIWAIGDSTTKGMDQEWTWRGFCPHETYGHISGAVDAQVDGNVSHSGIFGQTAAPWAAPYSPLKSGWAGIIDSYVDVVDEPDVVVVLVGANDVNLYRGDLSDADLRDEIIAAYHTIVDEILAKWANKPIVLCQIPPFGPSQVNDNALIDDLVDDVDAESWPASVEVLDLHTGFETNGDWHRDAIHWTDEGSAYVGRLITEKLDAVLGM